MTDKQIRIALAKFEGWTLVSSSSRGSITGIHPVFDGVRTEVEDYPNDLNAVRRVENLLTPDQRLTFLAWIEDYICKDVFPRRWAIANADARSRCEAILRTLRLWKDV